MKYGTYLLLFFAVVILLALYAKQQESGGGSNESDNENLEQIQAEKKRVADSIYSSLAKEFAELEQKFIKRHDEFQEVDWYFPKSLRETNEVYVGGLEAHVNSKGYFYLTSTYNAQNWLFHEKMAIKCKGQLYETQRVPTYNENNRTSSGSWGVSENVDYSNEISKEIAKAISNSDTSKVLMRLEGREYYRDFTLTGLQKQAVADAYRLQELINQLK